MNTTYRITVRKNEREASFSCFIVSESDQSVTLITLNLRENNIPIADTHLLPGLERDLLDGKEVELQASRDDGPSEPFIRNFLQRIFGNDAAVNFEKLTRKIKFFSANPLEQQDEFMFEGEGDMVTSEAPEPLMGFMQPPPPQPEKKYAEVQVLYATDRKRTSPNDVKKLYSAQPNNMLEYGRCTVSIPENRKIGEIPRPGLLPWNWIEKPEKHVMILEIEALKGDAYFGLMRSMISGSGKKDAFIFIHGYNVSFANAVYRTAQMKYDLQFEGAAITYSWPSFAKTLKYPADEVTVERSVPHLVAFIKDVISRSPELNKLHLIAHSMGNRALTQALKELQDKNEYPAQIDQVILAAPDIDSVVFTERIAPAIGERRRVTLYASDKDKAMQVSRKYRSDLTRAGEGGENITVTAKVDTIDASAIDFPWYNVAHSYFGDISVVINDIFNLLHNQHGPAERNLIKKTAPSGLFYWEFPKSNP